MPPLATPAVQHLLDTREITEWAGVSVDRECGWLDSNGDDREFGETRAGMALWVFGKAFGLSGRD